MLVIMGWIQLWHVYVFAFLRGTSMALDQPARQAVIPSILPRHLVTNAMALNTGSAQIMRLGGAAGAGLLIATIGMGPTFMAVAILNVLTWALSIFIRIPDIARKGYQGPRLMLKDFKEGFAFAWNSPVIRGILVIALVYFTFGSSFMQVFAPYFSEEVMGIGESGFGYMMAISGLGGVSGALLLAKINPSKSRGKLLLLTTAIFGVFLVLFALTTYTNWIVLAFVVAAFLGLGQAFTFPLMNSVLVDSSPPVMRGRIMSLISLDRAMISLGGAMAGFSIALIGGQPAQIVFGIACTLVSIAALILYPSIRQIS